jgi:hypothetical protein
LEQICKIHKGNKKTEKRKQRKQKKIGKRLWGTILAWPSFQPTAQHSESRTGTLLLSSSH